MEIGSAFSCDFFQSLRRDYFLGRFDFSDDLSDSSTELFFCGFRQDDYLAPDLQGSAQYSNWFDHDNRRDEASYHADKQAEVATDSVTDEDSVEGFGMSYLEASSCGTPTIGARDSGAEAAIEDGITGFLVEHDPEDIARAMSRILEDHELSERMGKAAVLHAKDFSWERIANRYRMYLNEVLR